MAASRYAPLTLLWLQGTMWAGCLSAQAHINTCWARRNAASGERGNCFERPTWLAYQRIPAVTTRQPTVAPRLRRLVECRLMEIVRLSLLFLHLLGMSLLLGSFLVQLRVAPSGPLSAGWLHGSLLQLITGVGLVGVNEIMDRDLDRVKVTVKLLVLLVILGAIVVYRRRAALATWVAPTLAGLVVANVAVAVFWT